MISKSSGVCDFCRPDVDHFKLSLFLQLEYTTQQGLDQIANWGIRCGATVDPQRRNNEYAREGYRGTMYCAETKNMRTAENRLLHKFDFKYNKQKNSNVAEDSGYVYIITGKKNQRNKLCMTETSIIAILRHFKVDYTILYYDIFILGEITAQFLENF